MNREHSYRVQVRWSGGDGGGTSDQRTYSRDHAVDAGGKPEIAGSADPAFRGDATRWSPEDLLVAALAQCHMLSYLYEAVVAGVVVTQYDDEATGTMVMDGDGGAHFTKVTLHPVVTVADEAMRERADALHERAAALCFIGRSVNFPVRHEASSRVAG